MQCEICLRKGGAKLPLLCPIDARNYLYESRIEYTSLLIEKDALDQQVTAAISQITELPGQKSAPLTSIDLIAIQAKKDETLTRTQLIIAKADELRDKVEQAQQDLVKRRAVISRRKSDLASASNGLSGRRSRLIDDLEKSIHKIKGKWHQIHTTTMSARTFLCGEAARLYGLKKVKSKSNKDEYRIGRSLVMDLEKLNDVSEAQISTVLSHIVHLLVLSAHYLGLRLPAEITLPHRDYPLPTVFPLQSSHKLINPVFPSKSTSQGTLSISRRVEKPHSLPRPLFIHKPLSVVASEDASEYSLFLEGVSLLAFNIVWACRSQGIAVGDEGNFHDTCNIGRNLFNLLIGTRPRLSLGLRVSTIQTKPNRGVPPTSNPDAENRALFSSSPLGIYSHNTAYSFLGSADGIKMIRAWQILSPTEITEHLRSHLMGEVANAEWEVLNADAWDDYQMGDVSDTEIAMRRQRRIINIIRTPTETHLNTKSAIPANKTPAIEGERKAGTSGWTKLKPR